MARATPVEFLETSYWIPNIPNDSLYKSYRIDLFMGCSMPQIDVLEYLVAWHMVGVGRKLHYVESTQPPPSLMCAPALLRAHVRVCLSARSPHTYYILDQLTPSPTCELQQHITDSQHDRRDSKA